MEKRENLILSSVLSEFPKFQRVYGKIPQEIKNVGDSIVEIIKLHAVKLLDTYSEQSLHFEESGLSDDEEDTDSDLESRVEKYYDPDFDPE